MIAMNRVDEPVSDKQVVDGRAGEKQLVSKEPWPAKGIEAYSCIADGDWGYLLVFSDASFQFDCSQRPGDQEILRRWSVFFSPVVGGSRE